MRLKDKVSIITGASSGIGEACAKLFAREGAKVVLVARRMEVLEKIASEIKREGGEALPVKADISNPEEVNKVVEETVKSYGTVHILINNAGLVRDNLALKLTPPEWEEVLKVNLLGTFYFCQAVFRPMRRQRYGKIVNTASVAIRGNIGQANYAAAKAGVVALTRTLALEYARTGIRVNCVAPGVIETPMTESFSEDMRKKILERIPLGYLGRPEDVAYLHLFLASPESDYITGQVFFIDGGLTVGV
jgi:3-oxoacyl-[acyl-carrier protein] reductase